ncbi:hypothetical protein [Promicromonospora sp. NPDC090134]|uniref:hypothetical protein n=1 Tax=Promicromonospora sp. NPDC090134 TaxID=3364408 RepID=UPI003800159F
MDNHARNHVLAILAATGQVIDTRQFPTTVRIGTAVLPLDTSQPPATPSATASTAAATAN